MQCTPWYRAHLYNDFELGTRPSHTRLTYIAFVPCIVSRSQGTLVFFMYRVPGLEHNCPFIQKCRSTRGTVSGSTVNVPLKTKHSLPLWLGLNAVGIPIPCLAVLSAVCPAHLPIRSLPSNFIYRLPFYSEVCTGFKLQYIAGLEH